MLAAVKKAGYKTGSAMKDPATAASSAAAALTKLSTSNSVCTLHMQDYSHQETADAYFNDNQKKLSPKKRKRDDNLNEFLPEWPQDGAVEYGSLDFDELLDEPVRPPLIFHLLYRIDTI